MGKIFCFDDGTPMSFALTPHSALVEAAIESVGGQVTSMPKAHFKVYTGRGPYATFSTPDSECGIVDVGWIEKCIESNILEPIYPYLLLQGSSGLATLDSNPNVRDLGELIKAIVTCKGHRKRAYMMLHEQYPHKTSLQWEELHKGHRPRIKKALEMIEIRMKIQTDTTLCRQLVPGGTSVANTTPRVRRNAVSVSTLSSSKYVPQKPRAHHSAVVKDISHSSIIKTKKSSGVATTDEHLMCIAAFLVQRKEADPNVGYPSLKEWMGFKATYDAEDIRSIDAWRSAFRHWADEILNLANKECRKRNLSVYSLPPK